MENIRKILFLPFLQIPSGHHQVADAIIEGITQKYPQIKCEKIDILSYSYGKIENFISTIYLRWIQTSPSFYNSVYQRSVYKNAEEKKRYRLYEYLFKGFMKKLINEKQPDFIVCTHALPSYMLNALKEQGEISIPVINIYTDYFIHRFWGVKNIDYHLTPSKHMKDFLKRKGLKEKQIYTTGIPIHHKIKKQTKSSTLTNTTNLSILITGGNLGVGAIEELVEKIERNSKVNFFILCGKNDTLYEKIKNAGKSNIVPLRYIKCKNKMNKLYDQMDGIITKPGGVTISESLFKRIPIFVYHALPGQEIINLQQLKKLGVIFEIMHWEKQKLSLDQFIQSFFKDDNLRLLKNYHSSITQYHKDLDPKEPVQIIEDVILEKMLK